MEVALTTGASLHSSGEWHSLNWPKINRNVRRLQARIVKAIRAGQNRKARALQFILTRSLSGKALTVRRVTENQGKRTPGVDGEIWNTPGKKTQRLQSLQQRGSRAKPLRRVYIPKPHNPAKKRGLSIPIMRDRAMQALHKLALDPIAETLADPNSYGFRPELNIFPELGPAIPKFIWFDGPMISSSPAVVRNCWSKKSNLWLSSFSKPED